PAIVVSCRSADTGCGAPDMCGVEIVDATLPQGSGYHGSFGRADTRNFMAAVGPDFRAGFVDQTPVSNADIAPTIAHVLGFELPTLGHLHGRVIAESLARNARAPAPAATTDIVSSAPAANGFRTVLNRQSVGENGYFDSGAHSGRANYPRRTKPCLWVRRAMSMAARTCTASLLRSASLNADHGASLSWAMRSLLRFSPWLVGRQPAISRSAT